MLPPVADGADTVWFSTATRYVRDGEWVDRWLAGFARRLRAVARTGMIDQLTMRERALIHEQYVRPCFGALLEFLAWSIEEFGSGRILLRDRRGQVAHERAGTAHRRRLLIALGVAQRAAEIAEVVALARAEVTGQRVPPLSPPWDDDPPVIG